MTNGGNILLETTTAGNLVLNQMVNTNNGSPALGAGSLGLSSAGTLTQGPGGVIVASASRGAVARAGVARGFCRADRSGGPEPGRNIGRSGDQCRRKLCLPQQCPNLTIGTVDAADNFGARLLNPATGAALTGALSGVTTNNANLGLRATGPGGLTVAANVSAGSGGVGLESGGQVQVTGAISGVVEISSPGPVSLSASAPATISAQITGAGNSFTFRDNGATLTIGSSGALAEQGTGTPPNNQMLSPGGLSGVTTNNGNILLETVRSGDLVLNQAVNAGTGSVGLASAGTITQDPAPIIASQLAILSAGPCVARRLRRSQRSEPGRHVGGAGAEPRRKLRIPQRCEDIDDRHGRRRRQLWRAVVEPG